MLTTFRQRERREGIVLKTISFPVPPPSMDDLYQRFERAVTPKTKLILVCHITNRTGQIFPIRKICDMAHSRGIPVIVDGAHAFSHFPYKLSDLNCDYYGVSLHEMAVRADRDGIFVCAEVADCGDLAADGGGSGPEERHSQVRGNRHASRGNHDAISQALVFTENIGIERKSARLRYLRNRWAHRLRENPKCKTLHSEDPAQSCGIGFLAFYGVDPAKIHNALWSKYNILTAMIGGEEYSGLRVTPHVYSTVKDVDYFAEMVEKEVKG